MSPHFTVRNLKQTAVYWGDPRDDGFGGFTWEEDPREIPCRWEEKNQVVKNSKGVEVLSNINVQVEEDLAEEGLLFLGTLDSLSEADLSDPKKAGAYQIAAFTKVPTMNGRYFFRKAFL